MCIRDRSTQALCGALPPLQSLSGIKSLGIHTQPPLASGSQLGDLVRHRRLGPRYGARPSHRICCVGTRVPRAFQGLLLECNTHGYFMHCPAFISVDLAPSHPRTSSSSPPPACQLLQCPSLERLMLVVDCPGSQPLTPMARATLLANVLSQV